MKIRNQSKTGNQQRGASLLEYSQVLALIILIAVPSINLIGRATTKPLCEAGIKALNGNLSTGWKLNESNKTVCKYHGQMGNFFAIDW